MAMNSPGESLRAALERDLNKGAPGGGAKVLNDVTRKIFTLHRDGVVFEFAHRQPDDEYWSGVKYYASGSRSRVRLKRTPDTTEKATPTAKTRKAAGAPSTSRKKKAAKAPAEGAVEIALS